MTLSNKLLSKLFETTNPSGASCLSRCLIYKVHTARSAAGLYLSTLSSLCQALFSSFFQNLFRANRFGPRQLLPQRFCILAHPPAFVKNFFRLFQIFLFLTLLPAARCVVLADSLAIIPLSLPFVNSFFQIFLDFFPAFSARSEERRVGKECSEPC